MSKRIQLANTGGSEVLEWVDVEPAAPAAGEVRIANKAVGLNFIDIYFRTGLYPAPAMPTGLGTEGAGIVDAVGEGVTHLKVGDRVAYAQGPLGAYAELHTLPASKVVNKGRDPIRLVDVVLPAVLAALPPERLVISSFDPVALAHCRQHAPKEALALGALFGSVPKNWREQCEAVEAFSIHPHWPRLKQTQAAAMCRDGYQILCYTANDPSAFDSRWAWGIASAITDEPAAFKRYLDNRQRAGQPA